MKPPNQHITGLFIHLFSIFLCFTYEVESTTVKERDLLENFARPALAKLNTLRTEFELNPLKLDDELTRGAQDWADQEAKTGRLRHSCGPCDGYSELLSEKVTSGNPPKGAAAVDWALGRWFGSLFDKNIPASQAANAYNSMLKRPNLGRMGIGIGYGVTANGEKTAFAVARFANAKARYG